MPITKGLSAVGFHIKFCKLGCWWDYRTMFLTALLIAKTSSKILYHYLFYIFPDTKKKKWNSYKEHYIYDDIVSTKYVPVNDIPKPAKSQTSVIGTDLRLNWLFTEIHFLISLLFQSLSFSILNILLFKYLCKSVNWNAKYKWEIFKCKILGFFK